MKNLSIESLCINTIRTLSMDAVQRAHSGHPGTPMALAPVAFTLWDKFLRFNPQNPEWYNRDRFILSAGHASMLLYSLLHINGFDLSLDEIKSFRQLHSKCPGHPEYGLTPGVETTTGPLGQGLATSVGMAIAEKWLKSYFNKPEFQIINYMIYAIAGDGCLMEGVSGEAASLAGHLGLDNLVWIYDNNHITIEGSTELTFTEDVAARFLSYNWNLQRVGDANDLNMLERALRVANKEKERPSLIIVDSHIAYGSPHKQDTSGAHGLPLGEEEIKATKRIYGCDPDKNFFVPDEVKEYCNMKQKIGKQLEEKWLEMFHDFRRKYPKLAKEFDSFQKREFLDNWKKDLPVFPPDEKGLALRSVSGEILNIIAEKIPWFMGGAADLSPSTKTYLKGFDDFQNGKYNGRNLHFGIREHAMGAILNGLSHSKIRPFGATFLVFSDYLKPPLRLSALMEQPVIYIFTHDSIAVGEDGPTHQPIEHLAALRSIPHFDVIRPADANEVVVMWRYIMSLKEHPVALILTRQAVPTFDRTKYASAEGALKGAYILADSEKKADVILIATGSEVQLCLKAYIELMQEGIATRVISMPCRELYERQNPDYWEKVLPNEIKARVIVEAGSTVGWRRYAGRHDEGSILGLRDFGESAPIKDVLNEFGLTVEAVVEEAKKTIARVKNSI